MWISHFQKPVLSALVFFGTLLTLSVGYAALNGGLSLSDKASGSMPLSSISWNKIVDGILDLDARTAGIATNAGNIGIGTANPNAALDVNGGKIRTSRSNLQYLEIYGGDSVSTAPYVQAYSSETNKKPLIFQSFHAGNGSPAGSLGFRFEIGTPASPSYAMWITEAGNVGIGTTSPSEKLDIGGNVKASGTVLMGYERMSVDCSNATSCVATCPTGKKVLGGGCVRINGGANNLQDAMPSYDTTFNCNWATAPITSRAYAICARIGN